MTISDMKRLKSYFGLTNTEVAERSGVPVGTVNKVFAGTTKNPGLNTIALLEAYFKKCSDVADSDAIYIPETHSLDSIDALKEAASVYGFSALDGAFCKPQGTYTIADLDTFPEGITYELIDGWVYALNTPKVMHQLIISEFSYAFQHYIREKDGNCLVFIGNTSVYEEGKNNTWMIPDFSVICDRKNLKEDGISGGPDFVLEVLSDSTREKDMGHKAYKFRELGVREYWIIDPKKKLLIKQVYEKGTYEFCTLKGKKPVNIYNGGLEIDLDKILKIIEEFK